MTYSRLMKFFLVVLATAIVYAIASLTVKLLLEELFLKPSNIFGTTATTILTYSDEFVSALVVGVGGILAIREIMGLLDEQVFKNRRFFSFRLLTRVSLYGILIAVILVALGVNLTGALVGGAVGGVVIGLAVQAVASNVLSGVLATSSEAVTVGQGVILQSWIWSPPVVGEVVNVKTLYTEVKTINGNLVKIPNSAFLGNTVFTKLGDRGEILYPVQVTINSDVNASVLSDRVRSRLSDSLSKLSVVFDLVLSSKSGSQTTFTVILKYSDMSETNRILDLVNRTFEDVYWEIKESTHNK